MVNLFDVDGVELDDWFVDDEDAVAELDAMLDDFVSEEESTFLLIPI